MPDSTDRERLLKKADQEDGCQVSVGGLYVDAWHRAIDALVAEHVFGKAPPVITQADFDREVGPEWEFSNAWEGTFVEGHWDWIAHRFTTSWLHAGAVLERMRKRGYCYLLAQPMLGEDEYWAIEVLDPDPKKPLPAVREESETGPEGICLAALRALGVSVPEKPE